MTETMKLIRILFNGFTIAAMTLHGNKFYKIGHKM